MDLVCRLDTRRAAREMLLDDFMGGFLYKLVVQKWSKFARHYHLVNILFGAIQLLGLFMLVMDKQDPWRPRGCVNHPDGRLSYVAHGYPQTSHRHSWARLVLPAALHPLGLLPPCFCWASYSLLLGALPRLAYREHAFFRP